MKNVFVVGLLLITILTVACKPKMKSEKEVKDFFETYYEDYLKLNPIDATQQGDNRYNDTIPNTSTDEYDQAVNAFYDKYLSEIKAFEDSKLSPEDSLNIQVLKYNLVMGKKGANLPISKYLPANQFWGLHLLIAQMGSGTSFQPFKTVKDYENWLKRLDDYVAWVDSSIARFKQGLVKGYTLPPSLVLKMIPQMESMVVKDYKKSIFYTPITNIPESFSKEDKSRLDSLYQDEIMSKVVPSYVRFRDFLKDDYLPNLEKHCGFVSMPKGEEEYAYWVKYWTTTDKTPDEIFEIGKSEVARIRGEMEKVKEQVGFKGTLEEFFKSLKNDKKLKPYKTAQEVLDAFQAIYDKIKPHLKDYFSVFPKTGFEIRQTEAFRAASASAEYQPGSADGSRPGIFYVPILNPKEFNISSGMESLFLHEAIPGHHYQISLQQENKDLPRFRRYSWYGAYGEGWALYCESLGKELGLYTNPYQYFGSLGNEMHRAIRLVVDVGLHAKGWTREEAIQYMLDNEAETEQYATMEIERYMAIPGQALSYKIGQMKFIELREKYEKELGDKFSWASFHDKILSIGNVPLSILETEMDKWANGLK